MLPRSPHAKKRRHPIKDTYIGTHVRMYIQTIPIGEDSSPYLQHTYVGRATCFFEYRSRLTIRLEKVKLGLVVSSYLRIVVLHYLNPLVYA